jgi:DNA polymerase III epsilon subunit-like protein
MASTTARMSRVPVLSDVRVQTITRENSHDIFGRIKQALLQRRGRRVFISIDLEYAASSETDVSSQQRCSMQWYESLKNFVDGGDTVQLGLVFAFDSECPEPVQAYEVNIQFDETSRSYSDKSISFLIDNGHVLEDYRNQGVLPEWLYADLLRHFPFYDESVTWVTFHADRDIGFLMKLAVYGGRGLLPNNKLIFMHDASRCFPVLFDVRVLAQVLIPGFRGSLKNLANHLGIQRTGKEHFAGSDALLTIGCFLKVVEQSADEGLVARIGLLSGAEELEMSIQCALSVSHSAIYMKDVMWEKYPEEGARIHETMRSNFNVIGVQVPFIISCPVFLSVAE